MQRAGHADFETTKIYLREAENLAAGFGTVFPPLPEGLGNIAPISPRAIWRQLSSGNTELFCGADGNRTAAAEAHEVAENKPDPEPERVSEAPAVDTSAQASTDADTSARAVDAEADLERRMVAAELAGRTTVADALAKRLEALRAAKRAGNVIALPLPRRA